MKCHVCKRPFENGEAVIRTVVKGKDITVCGVEKKPGCAHKIDKQRGQQDAFPKGLWAEKVFKVRTFDCVGATVTKVDASFKDQKVIQVKLSLPGGASLDNLSGFMGDTVTLFLSKSTLVDIDKPKANKNEKVKGPEPIPITRIVTNPDDLKKLSKAEIVHVHQVCQFDVKDLIAKTGLKPEQAEDIYDRCWKAHEAAQWAIQIDTLGFKPELAADLKAAGIETAQQIVDLGTVKTLREKTGLAQSRCPQVLKACKAAVDGAAAAQKRISKDNEKAKDNKTAA